MAKVDREKLRQLVAESGRSARALSLDAKLGATAIKDILSGKSRDPGAETLAAIASQLGRPVTELMDASAPAPPDDPRIVPRFLPTRFRVQAGNWVEVDDPPAECALGVLPDRRYASWPQWLEQVQGPSANKKVPDGHFIHVVDAIEMGYAPRNGDWVVVERRRYQGRLRERSLKQVEVTPQGDVHVWPRSTDERFQEPLTLTNGRHGPVHKAGILPEDAGDSDTEVEIVGLVIGAYNPDF